MHAVNKKTCPGVRWPAIFLLAVLAACSSNEKRLIDAARKGQTEKIRILLETDVDVDAVDDSGRTALHWAVDYDVKDIAGLKLLLDRGADVNVQDTDGNTVLMGAVFGRESSTAQFLLDAGADANMIDIEGKTALHLAAQHGYWDMITILLSAGADTGMVDIMGDTPLILSARDGHDRAIEYLLNTFPDLSIRNSQGETALEEAQSQGHTEVIDLFAEHEKNRNYLLSWASDQQILDEVQALLGAGSGTGSEGKRAMGGKVLLRAAEKGHSSMVELLARAGVDVNAKTADGETVLMRAIKNHCNSYAVSSLLQAGADVKAKDGLGKTALMCASLQGRYHLKRLLDYGADVNARDNVGRTALMWAQHGGSALQATEYLLEVGADANASDSHGRTVLMHAASDYNESVGKLLEAGADMTARDNNGETALMWAMRVTAYPDVLILLNGDLNVQDNIGETALIKAAKKNYDWVGYLLDAGADAGLRDNQGKSALGWAIEGCANYAVQELEKAGARN